MVLSTRRLNEGTDTIRLRRDEAGQHHYIPLSRRKQVVEGRIQVDRSAKDVMAQWSSESMKAMARG